MGRVEGKVAIVTGAGRLGNIGVAVCRAFLREGAKAVVATDMRSEQAQEIKDLVASDGYPGAFRLVEHDVTSEADWERVVADTLAEFGQLDVLVNNAGISIHGGVEDTSLEDLRKVMGVNHDGAFLGIKYCAPALAESIDRFPGGGSVINTVSMASYMPNGGNIGYHVSKSAQRMLTLCAAVELGPKRVRVNSVHPGQTTTPLLREHYDDAGIEWLVNLSPLGIESVPEDTAHAFVYLASDEARFVTGASIYHDGGLARHY
ncbi:MAG: SDR family oxidoreductase [Novosphingobium sp.]|nr:SDR family oxidoreductase [Novosphingobium sp.]